MTVGILSHFPIYIIIIKFGSNQEEVPECHTTVKGERFQQNGDSLNRVGSTKEHLLHQNQAKAKSPNMSPKSILPLTR